MSYLHVMIPLRTVPHIVIDISYGFHYNEFHPRVNSNFSAAAAKIPP